MSQRAILGVFRKVPERKVVERSRFQREALAGASPAQERHFRSQRVSDNCFDRCHARNGRAKRLLSPALSSGGGEGEESLAGSALGISDRLSRCK